jgi:polyphosphate glucokinase
MKVLGIDIGGTGIKGAVVDTDKGTFASDRIRIETPHPATPEAVAAVVAEIVQQHGWDGPAGACFPGVVKGGTVHTAPNLDPAWVGRDAQEVFQTACGLRSVKVLNDADAAGLGEAHFGKPEKRHRTVLFLTLGTGIGSALVYDGALVPNTELGHLPLNGMDAEKYAAESIREKEHLSYEEWAGRLSEYLQLVEDLLWPDVFVLGGGISKHPDPWLGLIRCRTEVRVATLANKAGIIGAALDGRRHHKKHHG